MGVVFRDNSKRVLAQFERNKIRALEAIGEAAVSKTVDYMENKYERRIYETGDLMRSIMSAVRDGNDAVDIGASPYAPGVQKAANLKYAEWVHNGTAKMPARPFLRDALLENVDIWKEVAAEKLGEGMGAR